jgi:hypothetical protein
VRAVRVYGYFEKATSRLMTLEATSTGDWKDNKNIKCGDLTDPIALDPIILLRDPIVCLIPLSAPLLDLF